MTVFPESIINSFARVMADAENTKDMMLQAFGKDREGGEVIDRPTDLPQLRARACEKIATMSSSSMK